MIVPGSDFRDRRYTDCITCIQDKCTRAPAIVSRYFFDHFAVRSAGFASVLYFPTVTGLLTFSLQQIQALKQVQRFKQLIITVDQACLFTVFFILFTGLVFCLRVVQVAG